MNLTNVEGLPEIYTNLKAQLDAMISGELPPDKFKPTGAPLGIYQQRNGLFMARVRITGGHLTTSQLYRVAEFATAHQAGFIHISTRQDLQIHDVAPEQIFPLVSDLDQVKLHFKGGGGDTYRNALMSPDSGFGVGTVFDVMPYLDFAHAVIRNYSKAFSLPRKIKVGFFSKPADLMCAKTQDLGFFAVKKGAQCGFQVFGGGGMGRVSRTGILLFDFLSEQDFARALLAMTDLFYDHGDRQNRSKARIRFILERLGETEFRRLFMEYFKCTEAVPFLPPTAISYPVLTASLPQQDTPVEPLAGYRHWLEYAVLPTIWGSNIKTVRLFVPHGVLSADQLTRIGQLADRFSCRFLRITQAWQNFLLPLVHESMLPALYNALIQEFPDLDLTVKSLTGNLLTCIGADVCKIGILPSPQMGDLLASSLEAEVLPPDTPEKMQRLKAILNDIRISGCPNACSGHPLCKIGMQGQKIRVGETMEPAWLIFKQSAPDALGQPISEAPTPMAEVPAQVKVILDEING